MNKLNLLKAGLKFCEFKVLGRYTSTYCWHDPIVAEIDITGKCNFNCIWCYRKVDSPDYRNADFIHVVDVIRQLKGCRLIDISAMGEPLCVPVDNLRVIIDAAKKSADKVILTTNGSLLMGDMARMLGDSGIDVVSVSVDSYKPDIYRRIRNYDLDKIVDNIKSFREIYSGRLQLNVVLTEETMKDMYGMVDFAASLKIDNILFQSLKKYPDMVMGFSYPVGHYKNRKMIYEIKKHCNELGINVSFSSSLFCYPILELCRTPFYMFSMDVGGYFKPCCSAESKHMKGLVFVDSVRGVWNHRVIRNFRKDVIRGSLPYTCRTWCNRNRKDLEY